MQKQKFGRIVNFSSSAVESGGEGLSVYSASKAAVEQLTKVLAEEFKPFGITVNAIAPGVVPTELSKNLSDKAKKTTINEIILAIDTCLTSNCSGQIFRLI